MKNELICMRITQCESKYGAKYFIILYPLFSSLLRGFINIPLSSLQSALCLHDKAHFVWLKSSLTVPMKWEMSPPTAEEVEIIAWFWSDFSNFMDIFRVVCYFMQYKILLRKWQIIPDNRMFRLILNLFILDRFCPSLFIKDE